jgi:hypothetical protein
MGKIPWVPRFPVDVPVNQSIPLGPRAVFNALNPVACYLFKYHLVTKTELEKTNIELIFIIFLFKMAILYCHVSLST